MCVIKIGHGNTELTEFKLVRCLNIGKVLNRNKSFRVNPCFRGKQIKTKLTKCTTL